ncbi:MAG: translocation/assembly module TamB [Spirochaetaceae bacterium]|nr:translocation/assembly module TamB [Spirochaetaceae bacterium]
MTLPDKNAKKILIAALILVVLALFSALALRPAQLRMLAAIEDARDTLLAQAETFLGKKIAYASMGLAFPVLIDIRGVSIAGGNSGIPDFSIARVRVRYSLREILLAFLESKEKTSLDQLPFSIKEVVIDKPDVIIDIDALSAHVSSREPSRNDPLNVDWERELQKIFAFLPNGLIVRLNKGVVGVAAAEVAAHLKTLKATVQVKKSRVKLSASWKTEGSISSAQVQQMNNRQPLPVEAGSRVRADFSVADGSGRGTLWLSRIRSSLLDIPQMAFTATLADRKLSVEKIGGRLPYALSADLDLGSGAAAVTFSAERFAAYSFATVKGGFRRYTPWIPAVISGTARVTTTLGAQSMDPQFDVRVNGVFRRQSPLGASTFVVQGTGDTRRARLSRLGLTLPQEGLPFKGDLSFSGTIGYRELALDGVFRVKDFMMREDRPLSGEFIVDTHDRTTTLFAETFFLGDVEFSAFNVDVTREEQSAIIGVSALRFRETAIDEETGFGDIRLGRLSIEGFFNWKEKILDLSLVLEEMSAQDLLAIAHVFVDVPELPDMLDTIIEGTEFTTDVFVSTDFKSVTYSIPVFVTAYTGKEKNGKSTSITAAASIFGTETRVSIVESTINLPDGTLNLSADFDFADFNDILFRTEFTYKDLFYYVSGQVMDNSITLSGSYDLQAFFSLSDTGSFSGYLRTNGARIPYKDQVVNVNLTTSLRYDSIDDWSFDVDTLEIQNLLIGVTPINALRITGRADQDGATLPLISLADAGGTLAGNGRVDWDLGTGGILFTANLSDTRGSEMFFAEGAYNNGALELHTNTTALKLARFLKNSFNASVSGIIDVTIDNIFAKTLDNWSLTVDLTSLAAEIGSSNVNIAARGEIYPDRLSLVDTRVNWDGIAVYVPSIAFANSRLDADAQLRGIILGRTVDLTLNTAVDFQNFTSLLRFKESFSDFDGTLSLSALKIDNWTMENPSGFTFSRHDAAVSLNGGPSNMVRLEMKETGEFYAGFSAPSPIRGTVTGNISGGNIAARGSNLYVDLLSLWDYIPAQNVINIKGGFAIADIEARGPLSDPEFYGTAQGASIRLDIPRYLNDEIGPVPIAIRLDGQEMRFGPVRAPCGTGYGMVTGVFEFSRWIPSNFTITIDVEEEHLIPYKVNIAGVKAHGETSGHMEIALQDAVLSVMGDLLGENTEITLDPAGFNQNVSPNPSPVIVDFTITTGRRVEFLWPNEDLPILQANPASGNSIHISSDNLSGGFELKGDIDIRSGEIFYIERSFYIREGTLTFNENETRFEPTIAARAETRDRTDDGPVTISLVIDNQPLTSFQARFESTPALSQADIFALLGQNIVGGATTETGQITGAFGGAITDVLSQFSVVRRIERAIRDTLHIDMFSVRTQAISNFFVQATSTQTRQDTDSSFSRYFDNTAVFLGKYLTSDFFVQGMLTFRYDDLADLTQRGLKFEPDIGIELRSPLFDIRWNIVPTTPQALFIPDTTFTILWRKTF